jgi:CubicO group peptidase (beta-lactamase class C family)
MTRILANGLASDRFAGVRATFENNLNDGTDIGASFTATLNGETVVDLWGGWADAAKTRPWEKDTLVNVYSTTKTMTFLVALMLADRGLLDFDAPVSRYWPEFAANGKEGVKVSHLMSHSSGLSGWKEPMVAEDLYDWEKATSLLAAQAPYWEPGTKPGYHAMTQGYLIGEVVRRITGQTIGTFFRKEVAEPLGADFHIGMGPEHDARVAELIPPPVGGITADGEANALSHNMQSNPPINVASTAQRAWRAAEIPAAGGQGNARSVAQIHAILANGGVAGGKRFLSQATCLKALELQIEGKDLILGTPVRYGMGFGLRSEMMPLPHDMFMYWGGYGGSLIIIDQQAKATYAYAMNKMAATTAGDMRAFGLVMATMQGMMG